MVAARVSSAARVASVGLTAACGDCGVGSDGTTTLYTSSIGQDASNVGQLPSVPGGAVVDLLACFKSGIVTDNFPSSVSFCAQQTNKRAKHVSFPERKSKHNAKTPYEGVILTTSTNALRSLKAAATAVAP